MAVPIALDLTRLALAPVRSAPRGIDRVELAYAEHFLNRWPGPCLPILPMPWGVRFFRRSQALDGLAAVQRLWRETVEDPNDDAAYIETKRFLEFGAAQAVQRINPSILQQGLGFVNLISATGLSFGQSVAGKLPQGTIYLNVGQLEVFRPFLTWLHRRPDIRSVMMIHDLLPLEYPEHHVPSGIRLHRAILKNVSEFGRALIVPSHSVRTSMKRALAERNGTNVPIHVEHLPVPSEFLGPFIPDPYLLGRSYFIVCGALDSHKNHMVLLRVWQQLIAEHGVRSPRLIVAASGGVAARNVADFLKSAPELAPYVCISPGLSTPALRQLIAHARALLMPSLAEGFGLPIVEALAQGTPVIASDIPAHREAGRGGSVLFVPATNASEWLAAVEAIGANANGARRHELYNPKTWKSYFTGIEAYFSEILQ